MEREVDFRARLVRLQTLLKKEGIAVYVGTRQAITSWLLGAFAPWRTAVIVPANGEPKVIYWRQDAERLRSETWLKDSIEWGHGNPFADVLTRTLLEMKMDKERIAVDLGSPISQQIAPGLILASEFLVMQSGLPQAQWVNAVPLIEDMLSVKDDIEIKFLRRAAEMADIGMNAAMDALEPGVTENAVAGEVERAIRLAGSEWSWSTTQGTEVGSGPRTAFKYGVTQPATEKRIEHGEMVIVDLHPMYQFYLSDFASNFYIGENPPQEVRRLADCWERTVETLLKIIKPGEIIDSVVQSAFRVIEEDGYSEWGIRGFGHGLGTCARIPPYMVPGNRTELRERMVMALGTHIYQPGVGGMRLELPVLITPTGAEPLCKWPSKLHYVR